MFLEKVFSWELFQATTDEMFSVTGGQEKIRQGDREILRSAGKAP